MRPIGATYPLEFVHLDFLTIGNKSDENKNIHVLVITDHFTKYASAYITPKQTAAVIANPLWENFLAHYGWPSKLLTDQGRSFESS